MGKFYEKTIRPLFFKIDPENVHNLAIVYLRVLSKSNYLCQKLGKSCREHDSLRRRLWELDFMNPIGLAGGFDKNAEAALGISGLGFGFIEVGTITPLPQKGNPRPRLFRLSDENALINRMGFNNKGMEYLGSKLSGIPDSFDIPLFINIGKNKITPIEHAVKDYIKCMEFLFNYGSGFVINISSPNTPDLRNLQKKEYLTDLLFRIIETRDRLSADTLRAKPVILKIAPDLTDKEIEDITAAALDSRIDGIIAANTTISRQGLSTSPDVISKIGAGGLSGKPLRTRSNEIISRIYRLSEGRLPIIGCGGIFSADDVIEKLKSGASLVQLYTGFIYEGPSVVRKIINGIDEYLIANNLNSITELTEISLKN